MTRGNFWERVRAIRPTPFGLALGTVITMMVGLIDVYPHGGWELLVQAIGLVVALLVIVLARNNLTTIAEMWRWLVPASVIWLLVELLLDGFVRHRVSHESHVTALIVTIFAANAFDFVVALGFLVTTLLAVSLTAALIGQFDLGTMNYVGYAGTTALFMAYFSRHLQESEARVRKAEQLIERDEETGLFTGSAGVAQLEAMIELPELGSRRVALIMLHPGGVPALRREFGYSSVQHLMQASAVRLLQLCGPKDVVCHWRDHIFLVGLRNVNRVELEGRAVQLQEALTGLFWTGGPIVQTAVAYAMSSDRETLEEVLALLEQRVLDNSDELVVGD